MSAPDYRDIVIEDLAASEAELREQVSLLEAERDGWRLLAEQAIHYAADLTQQLEVADSRRYIHRRRLDEQQPTEIERRQVAA